MFESENLIKNRVSWSSIPTLDKRFFFVLSIFNAISLYFYRSPYVCGTTKIDISARFVAVINYTN